MIIMELPKEFEERMKNMLGDEYNAFYDAFTKGERYWAVRINTLKDEDGTVAERLKLSSRTAWCADGYYTDKTHLSGKHPYHIAGLIYFQEPSAMAPGEALNITKGSRIIDMCAAPGGKTTQIAAKLKNTGIIVSNEIIPSRAKILAENVSRMGFSNVIVTNENPGRLADKYEGFFDIAVVDAPCSGEGMFRKEEQALQDWSIAHTVSCGQRQKNIVDSAIMCLAKGGQLLYSTCTFAPEENEEIAEYILKKYPYMQLQNPPSLSMLEDGLYNINGAKRIYPHKQMGEGHFIALFKDVREPDETYLKQPVFDTDKNIKPYREFESNYLNVSLSGQGTAFGDNLYMLPHGTDIDKIKVVYAGLHLGICKKNRFEPSHSLCLALKRKDFKNSVSFGCDSPELKKYLSGECISCDKSGWTAVCVDEFPIGWGKASGGILKNHFPKKFRLKNL